MRLGRPRSKSGYMSTPELGRQLGKKSAGTTIPGPGGGDALLYGSDTLVYGADALKYGS